MELLLEAGADPDLKVFGWTPLLAALRYFANQYHPERYARTADLLMARVSNPDARDYHGQSAILWAVVCGSSTIVSQLIAAGADLNGQDRWGRTPLMSAVERSNHEITQYLLAAGADTTICDKKGTTILHSVAFSGVCQLVSQLVERLPDVNACRPDGLTPLHVATILNDDKMVTTLLAHGARPIGVWCVDHDDMYGQESDDDPEFPDLLLPNNLGQCLASYLGRKLNDEETDGPRSFTVQEIAKMHLDSAIQDIFKGFEDE